MVRFYLQPSDRGTPILKSVALPTELPIHQDPGQNPASLFFLRHAKEAARYKETADFPEKTPTFTEFPANYASDSHFRYVLDDQILSNSVSEPVLEAPAVPRPARF